PGMALMFWAICRLPGPFSGVWAAELLLNLLASAAIVLAFSFCWGSAAFWAPYTAEEINSATARLLYQLKTFPLDGIGPVLRAGLMTAVPIGFLAWSPSLSLLGLSSPPWTRAATPLSALLFSLIAIRIFNQGLKHYGRTGSQRYLSFGHRR